MLRPLHDTSIFLTSSERESGAMLLMIRTKLMMMTVTVEAASYSPENDRTSTSVNDVTTEYKLLSAGFH